MFFTIMADQIVDLEAHAEGFSPLEDDVRNSYRGSYRREDLELGEKELEQLTNLLRRMLVIDPEERAQVTELLDDPWFSEASS
jgi:serine/threonine protein kinase